MRKSDILPLVGGGKKRVCRLAAEQQCDGLPAWISGNPVEWLRPRLAAARLSKLIQRMGTTLVVDLVGDVVWAVEFGIVEGREWSASEFEKVIHVPTGCRLNITTDWRERQCLTWSI